jgi:hypothetical protein
MMIGTPQEIARAELRALAGGELRDVVAFLCENGRDVLVFHEYSSDDTVWTSYKLRRRTRRDDFNAHEVVSFFLDDGPLH